MIFYYYKKKNLKQCELAARARMDPKRLNKIIKDKVPSPHINVLIKLSLALQLTPKETTELLARASRALNSSDPEHQIYKKLIRKYATMDLSDFDDDEFLCNANEFLSSHKLKVFSHPEIIF